MGTLVAAAICLGGSTAAFAADPSKDDSTVTPMGQLALAESGYSATLVVVGEGGAESIPVDRSDLTISAILKSRGYDPASFLDEKGIALELGKRLQNDEKSVVYSNTVTGSSETIELRLPDLETEDPNRYRGERIVDSEGRLGTALKTTVVHRDLSQLPQSPDAPPEKLDAETLSSPAAQTGEESYLTVLEAPEARRVTVGTKDCGSQYLCDFLKNGGLAGLQVSGTYVHPLGHAQQWTTYYGSNSHEGGAVDFPVATGTPIYAAADGVVEDSGWIGAGGNMVSIRHADGNLTGYAHMVELPIVKKGDQVKAGQVIGFVGSTGRSTGSHLHFESRTDTLWGTSIPVYEYMRLHGVDLGNCTEGPCSLSRKD